MPACDGNGVVWVVRVIYTRSLKIAPFDRAHRSSYSIRAPFLRYGKILVENRRFNLPHMYLAAPLGMTPLEFRRGVWRQKTRIAGRYLLDPMFSSFGTVPACDRRTDGHTTTAYTELAQRRAVKNEKLRNRRGTAQRATLANSCYVSRAMEVIKASNSKSDLQGHSRALAMVPFDTTHTIFY